MKNLSTYVRVCLLSSIVVVLFAVLQYQVVQDSAFDPVNYLIPIAVGLIFGYLLSRNMILKKRYNQEIES